MSNQLGAIPGGVELGTTPVLGGGGGGGVSAVTATSPIASSGGATPNITLSGVVAVAHGGTGSATAAGARTGLGLVIGTNVQAHSAALDAVTGTNTGDQTITLTGDVTGSGTGSFATTLANTAVTPGTYVGATVIVDSKGRITGAANATPTFISLAASRLGVTTDVLHSSLEDWDKTQYLGATAPGNGIGSNGFYFTLSGTGAATMVYDQGPGGIIRMTTGATSGSANNTYGPHFLDRVDTGKGYVKLRLKFEDTIDAQTACLWSFYSATGAASMGIGHVGSLSTTKIIFQYDGNVGGSKLDLINTDTAWHVYEIWYGTGDGKIHVAVDGTEVGTGVTPGAPLTTVLHDFVYVLNGTTNAERSMLCDYRYQATTFAS